MNKDHNQLHKRFFAMINFVWENYPADAPGKFAQSEDLREELIKRAGYYNHYVSFTGKDVYHAESISFGNISYKRLKEIYKNVWQVVASKIGPFADDEFTEELLNFKL